MANAKLQITYKRVDDLIPYVNNSRTHTELQVNQIAASISEFGFRAPILIDDKNGIIAGHGRVLAANKLGIKEIPTIDGSDMTELQKRMYVIADNKIALNAGWDEELLMLEIDDLREMGADIDLLGFDEAELKAFDDDETETGDSEIKGNLSDQFGAPPFTILDTRQGYWQNRRDVWLKRTGDLTATKEGVLASDSLMSDINNGSSNFDPVLAELMMRWFCPAGGKVLDPFGGEQTKGVVAGELGLNYFAVEFRQDQVNVNREACSIYDTVYYACGDSENIDKHIDVKNHNLCFTSPPYYDLEVYSKDDMSALGTYDEFMAKYERIFAKCYAMLADNAFLVIKIGEIRDKKTGIYRNFVGDNIEMFLRLGFKYYNELILINSFGTAPQRAGRMFEFRKMVKVHQNVLVFVKGDVKKAVAACGECDMDIEAVLNAAGIEADESNTE
jgi:hypothetical protein